MGEVTAEELPDFLYGTAWKQEQTEALVRKALEVGFRGVDTANQRKHYYEEGVGSAVSGAIEDGLVAREELFLQTKFTYASGQDDRLPYDPEASYPEQVRQSLDSSLEHLGTDYIDSLILHGPSTRSGLGEADYEVWETMEELAGTEKVGMIGVSNVMPDQLELLVDSAEVTPQFVQNRCFARTAWDQPVREICSQHGIRYQGFSLLTANQRELSSESVREIAERHGKTIQQVVFRFALQIGMLPLTGTTDEQHMEQDLACTEFELTEDEIETIGRIGVS